MVVGESGLGKSTLVNSLFLTDLYPERVIPDSIGKFTQKIVHKLKYIVNLLRIQQKNKSKR